MNSGNLLVREGQQLFWNYLSVISGQIGAIVCGILTIGLLTRLLSPVEFGRYSLIAMVGGFATTVLLSWPNAAVIRYGRERLVEKGNAAEIIWTRLAIYAASLVFSLSLLFILRSSLFGYIGISNSIANLGVLSVFVLSQSFLSLLSYVFQTFGHLKVFAAIPVLTRATVTLFFVFFLILHVPLTAVGATFFFALSHLVVAALTCFSLKVQSFLPVKVSGLAARQIVGYSFSLFFGAICSFAVGWMDLAVIKRFMTTADVGLYFLAYQMMSVLNLLIMSTISITFPIMSALRARGEVELIKRYLDSWIPVGILFWSILLSLVIAMSSFILPLIAGERYQPAVIPLAILLVGVAFNGIGCFYTSIINSFDLVPSVVFISGLRMVLNLVGDFLFVPLWGINGAAVAKSGAMALAALLYIPILHRSGHFSREWRRYLVTLWITPSVVALVGVLAFDAIPFHLSVAVLTSLLFLYLARRCSIIRSEDLAFLEKVHMPMLLKVSLRRILLSSASSST